jgi:hypothetical protein
MIVGENSNDLVSKKLGQPIEDIPRIQRSAEPSRQTELFNSLMNEQRPSRNSKPETNKGSKVSEQPRKKPKLVEDCDMDIQNYLHE